MHHTKGSFLLDMRGVYEIQLASDDGSFKIMYEFWDSRSTRYPQVEGNRFLRNTDTHW
jgi:hypothetical protein